MAAALQLSWSSPQAVTPSKVHSVRQLRENRFGLMKKANRLRVAPTACSSRPSSSAPSMVTRHRVAVGVALGDDAALPVASFDHVPSRSR